VEVRVSFSSIQFSGDESIRFVTFARAVLHAELTPLVHITGIQPITSDTVEIDGYITNFRLQGYRRRIIVSERRSKIVYRVGGANSLTSIAAKTVTFRMRDAERSRLVDYAYAEKCFVPGLGLEGEPFHPALVAIDKAIAEKSEANAEVLLALLTHDDDEIAINAALGLRAFAAVFRRTSALQQVAEQSILTVLSSAPGRDAKIALVEDLGYFGTDSSYAALAATLANPNEDDDVRWATALAIERLTEAIGSSDTGVRALLPGLTSKHAETRAATVLSLSRIVQPVHQRDLEPIFAGYLFADDPALRRHACAGLGQFSDLRPDTVARLCDLVLDPQTPVDVRGPGCLAISTCLEGNPDVKRRLRTELESAALTNVNVTHVPEPEIVWGLERIEELASALEMHVLLQRIHRLLARCNKLRAELHIAISLHEKAVAERAVTPDSTQPAEAAGSRTADLRGEAAAILKALHRARVLDRHVPSACVATLNFVVFVDDSVHREWVLERMRRVVTKHPARLIVLDSSGVSHDADVSCVHSDTEQPTVICERIDLAVQSLDWSDTVGLTRALVVQGIPTVVWWSAAALLSSETFQGLAELADAVVVDSSGGARDGKGVRELSEFAARCPGVVLHDLAFLRLAPWRDMIARFFDEPEARGDLFALRSLEIESGSQAEALYLGAWLANCISWKGIGPAAFQTHDGRDVQFRRVNTGQPRRVVRVTLASEHSTYEAAVCASNERVVQLSVQGTNAKPDQFAPLHRIDNPSLIEHAILSTEHEPMFAATLATVRELFPQC
jgi:glucose-6-phosphate dehydrogenase assembly protein OpcA